MARPAYRMPLEIVARPQPLSLEPYLVPGLTAAVAYAAFAQGGFYWEQSRVIVPAFAALALVAGKVALPAGNAIRAAFALLAAGLVASAAANGFPQEARMPLASLAVAACTVTAAGAAIRSGARRRLLEALAALGAVVAATGLIGLAWHLDPLAMKAQGIWRAATTLTYANAAAAFLLAAVPAALVLEQRRSSVATRLAAFAMLAALLATLSRGAVVGALVAAGAAAALGAGSLLRLASRPLAGALVAFGALVPSIASDTPRPGIAMAGLVIGAAIAALPAPRRRGVRVFSRLIACASIAAALAAGFAAAPKAATFVASRVAPASEDRLRFWTSAVDAGLDAPVFGSGPGTFEGADVYKGQDRVVAYAHSEYLQAFAETGVVGLAALALALVLFGAAVWVRRPSAARPVGVRIFGSTRLVLRVFDVRHPPEQRALWAAAVATCAGLFVQSAFDLVWRVPALVAIGFVWLVVALTAADERE